MSSSASYYEPPSCLFDGERPSVSDSSCHFDTDAYPCPPASTHQEHCSPARSGASKVLDPCFVDHLPLASLQLEFIDPDDFTGLDLDGVTDLLSGQVSHFSLDTLPPSEYAAPLSPASTAVLGGTDLALNLTEAYSEGEGDGNGPRGRAARAARRGRAASADGATAVGVGVPNEMLAVLQLPPYQFVSQSDLQPALNRPRTSDPGVAPLSLRDPITEPLELPPQGPAPLAVAAPSATPSAADANPAAVPAPVSAPGPSPRVAPAPAAAKAHAKSSTHKHGGPCMHCGATESPQWRRGPPNKPILCNACGTRYRRTNQLGAPTPAGGRPASRATTARAAQMKKRAASARARAMESTLREALPPPRPDNSIVAANRDAAEAAATAPAAEGDSRAASPTPPGAALPGAQTHAVVSCEA